jgi:isopenicillin N synthase-like dioxygenase
MTIGTLPSTSNSTAAPAAVDAGSSVSQAFGESTLGDYVKVVDMRDENAAEVFTQSLKDTGFGVLTNHGLDINVYDEWREFFKSGKASQEKYIQDQKTQDGYYSVKNAESAKGMNVKDLKQYFQLYFPDGRYPDEVSDNAKKMFLQMLELGKILLQWIDDHMDEEVRAKVYSNLSKRHAGSEGAPSIANVVDSKQTMLRILRYPPFAEVEHELSCKIEDVRPGAVRAAAHEDINLITLLPAGSSRGLEVKDMHGNWHEVPLCENSMIVNIGDMLQEMTNGEYKATTHRVVVPDGEDGSGDRMSCPCFIHPIPGTYLSDRWPDSLGYLHNRLEQQGMKLKSESE